MKAAVAQRAQRRLLAAALGALPALAVAALPASAQTRVNQDGRAMDANTQVGSDGSNDYRNAVDRRGQTYTGNQLVTGNVSGSRAFRGPVGYRDRLEFSGPVAGRLTDNFVRDSSGAPTRAAPDVNYGNQPSAFYGDARSTPPPQGYRSESFTGGYFNTGLQPTGQFTNPAYQSTAQVFESQTSMMRPGSVVLEGRDQNNQPMLLTGSPLYGMMQLNPSLLTRTTANNLGLFGDQSFAQRPDRFGVSQAELMQMREELLTGAATTPDQLQPDNGRQPAQADPNNLAQPLDPQALSSQPLDNSIGNVQGTGTESGRDAANRARNQGGTLNPSPQPGGAGDGRLDTQINTDRLGAGAADVQPGLERRMLISPAQQSKQVAALQQRLLQMQQSGRPPSAEEEASAARRLQLAQKAAGDAAEKSGQPVQPGRLPVARPGAGKSGGAAVPKTPDAPAAKPAGPAEPLAPAAARPAPLRIKSLAEGVEAKGLRDVLKDAEDLLQSGKYRSAIEKYAAAEQVAPNNAMIRLGRAHAELADTRYVTAERNLRTALLADPALLMGQFDLESFIGRERLSFLVKDLDQMAKTESASPRPMILLAYISYGMTGLEAAAADYLNEAARRAGRPDPLIEAMRKHWNLPAGSQQPAPAAPGDDNK